MHRASVTQPHHFLFTMSWKMGRMREKSARAMGKRKRTIAIVPKNTTTMKPIKRIRTILPAIAEEKFAKNPFKT